ncbi:hypothetical protein CRE_28951 [Caenorhabditis remanei]|uniref:F-box domain-containing protein n=1 Tax=Caenorhabditis remanei TaxID=31234 RepID=E3N5D2_CAERE|nr:hypothetical protein CRE_28951 [Caenorhabditis remanei]
MTTAFPLLRLPYLVLMPVLEQMEFLDRIALSILSKRTRKYVKLLKMKSKNVKLKWNSNRIEMIVFCDFTIVLEANMYIDEYQQSFFMNRYKPVYSWRDSSLLPADYVLSIMDVVHCKSIDKFIIVRISEHDCIPIVAKLPKIDQVVVEHIPSDSYYSYEAIFHKEKKLLKVLRTVFPVSSAVTISSRFQNHNHLREILKGNFDAVILNHFNKLITLNDLWITNAKILELYYGTINVRDLNRYFKLWMKKICNDRLEYLKMGIYDKKTVDLLLDGLNAVPVLIETQREFRVLGNVKQLCSHERIFFEFDITRVDGRTATIRISNYGNVIFYVWPESTNLVPNLVPNQTSLISPFSNSCIEHLERLFLSFLLVCESFFLFYSTNFNWNPDCDVLSICLSLLIVFLVCCFLNLLL